MDEKEILKSVNTCRVCLESDLDSIKSLFDSFNEEQLLSELHQYCTGLTIESTSSATTSICSNCEISLISSYQFKKLCENSEEKIQTTLSEFIKCEPYENEFVVQVPDDIDSFFGNEEYDESLNKIKCEIEEKDETQIDLLAIEGVFYCNRCDKSYKKDYLLQSHIERHHSSEHEDKKSKTNHKKNSKTESTIYSNENVSDEEETIEIQDKKQKRNKDKSAIKKKPKKLTEEEIVEMCRRKPRPTKVQELCIHCGIMSSRVHCNRHEKQVNAARNGEPKKDNSVTCDVCGKRFKHKYYLRPHLMKHNKQSRYTCEHCGEAFVEWITWKSHVAIKHTGIKRCICKLCGDGFFHSGQLTVHMRKHTGELPFLCEWPECTMRFINSQKLIYHMHSHTNERNHVCENCSATFKTKQGLKRHMTIHTGVKNFLCPVCNKAFIQPHMVKNHMKSHRGVDVEAVHQQQQPSTSHSIEELQRQFLYPDNLTFTHY